jgi:hypothetical protein
LTARLAAEVERRYLPDAPKGERQLAMILAGLAGDDGTVIAIRICSLTTRSKQQKKVAQEQLLRMEADGWLVRTGPRHCPEATREYAISSAWLSAGERSHVSASIEARSLE